jgi:hypothetical protein
MSEALITTRTRDGKVLLEAKETMALEVHPAPADLPAEEVPHWESALRDMPAKFLRWRNLGLVRQYTRLSVRLETIDPDVDSREYYRTLRAVAMLQNNLGLSVKSEVVRVRAAEDAAARRALREQLLRERLEAAKGRGGTDKDQAGGAPRGPSRASFSFTANGGHPSQ